MSIYGNNRTLLREGGSWSNSSYMPLDCIIESAQTDLAIFEDVIGNDFYHAYSEAGLIYVTEDDSEKKDGETKEGIFTKIKNFFKRIWEAIKGLFTKAKESIKNVIDNDKQLYEDNGELVRKHGAGKTINVTYKKTVYEISKFESFKDDKNESFECNQVLAIATDALNGIKDAAKRSADADEFDKIFDKNLEKMEKEQDKLTKSHDALFKEKEKEYKLKMTPDMVNTICNNIQSGLANITNMLDANLKVAQDQVTSAQRICDTLTTELGLSSASTEKQEEKRDKKVGVANAAAKSLNKIGEYLTKCNTIMVNYMTNAYKAQRAAFSQLAAKCKEDEDKEEENKEKSSNSKNKNNKNNSKNNNAKSKPKKENTPAEEAQNAAAVWAIGQLSDIYMEQAFNFY